MALALFRQPAYPRRPSTRTARAAPALILVWAVGLTCMTAPLLAAAAVAAPAAKGSLSPEDDARVARASAYLQGLDAAEGRFEQVDAQGRTSQGRFWLDRPGRIRFDYGPPSDMVVVADGRRVNVWNPRLKAFNAYPLGFTPLHVFLSKSVDLAKSARIDRVESVGDGFSVTLRDRRRPRDGAITLSFAEAPLRLTAWTLEDPRGQRTRVTLQSLTRTAALDPKLFQLQGPARQGATAPAR